LREVQAGDGPRRYDPNVGSDHQHLQCIRCGALWDVVPVGAGDLGLPPNEKHGFRLVNVDIVFRGLCPSCDNPSG
jgi:Fur family ferric uptake transcriptional regulator